MNCAAAVRSAAAELGARLRSCGLLTEQRSPYADDDDDDDEDDEDEDDEDEDKAAKREERRSGKGLPSGEELAVYHGAHASSLLHQCGVNLCLLPAVLAAVPPTEVSVHHLLRAELVARAAKHSLRARLLCDPAPAVERDWPWDVPVGLGASKEATAAALLNAVMFDPLRPVAEFEAELSGRIDGQTSEGGGSDDLAAQVLCAFDDFFDRFSC